MLQHQFYMVHIYRFTSMGIKILAIQCNGWHQCHFWFYWNDKKNSSAFFFFFIHILSSLLDEKEIHNHLWHDNVQIHLWTFSFSIIIIIILFTFCMFYKCFQSIFIFIEFNIYIYFIHDYGMDRYSTKWTLTKPKNKMKALYLDLVHSVALNLLFHFFVSFGLCC